MNGLIIDPHCNVLLEQVLNLEVRDSDANYLIIALSLDLNYDFWNFFYTQLIQELVKQECVLVIKFVIGTFSCPVFPEFDSSSTWPPV